MEKRKLMDLVKATVTANPSAPVSYSFGDKKFSFTELNDNVREECQKLMGNYADYRNNKNTIFELLETAYNEVAPKRVMEQYGDLAEFKHFAQGDKPVFTIRITEASKRRAKKFVSRVGLAGIYEVFKLDGAKLEIPTSAFGGAAQIGFEEFLDGRVNLADVVNIVLEGLDEQIYIEIEKGLKASLNQMPKANKVSSAGFNETQMDRLISIADSYGTAVIYCTYEFAATMVPSEGWVSEEMRNQKWNNGYLANYKGHKVVVFNQSFMDETNEELVIDPAQAWIIPVGAEKPVKIAFEGEAIVRDFDNRDYSMEVQVYQKFGVGVLASNNICHYENTSLKRKPAQM